MDPHVDRCYGYMAACLQQEYWVLPQISANYHMGYAIDNSKLDALEQLVAHVLEKKQNPSANVHKQQDATIDEIPV